MEVGAVKQAFNNELILLKKKLNQAKVQVINKLTRKAKTLAEKKAPEPLKEKLKRKAVSAINEVMLIKKIKARDIGKFIVTHTGQLQDYLNKPVIDHNKACARLLLHKALQDKYKFIRNRFIDVPIKDLFMSRQERLKLKKEARDKQKEKKKKKANKAAAKAGGWDVENIEMGDVSKELSDVKDFSGDEIELSDNEKSSDDEKSKESNSDESDQSEHEASEEDDQSLDLDGPQLEDNEESDENKECCDDDKTKSNIGKFVKVNSGKKHTKPDTLSVKILPNENIEKKFKFIDKEIKKKQETKHKDTTKNKNFNEKILQRKFKKESNEAPIQENKVVDPFFITSSGENYLSVAEPRQPDEIKEVHKQGNRQLRRAVMFGHVPKVKPRQNKFKPENERFNRTNGTDRPDSRFEKQNGFKKDRFNNNESYNERKTKFVDGNVNSKINNLEDSKPEKLHPSWEAKKRQSGILPYQGKKIVFD